MSDQEVPVKGAIFFFVLLGDCSDLVILVFQVLDPSLCFLTLFDKGIVADGGRGVSLACNKAQVITVVIVAAANKAPFFTLEGVLEAVFFPTTVADGGEVLGGDLAPEQYHVAKFIAPQDRVVCCARDRLEPRSTIYSLNEKGN
eukprot:402595-Ditylum_brightwellii.AAC.1